ncbi:MAG: hypothetical protein QM803_09770 [Rhodocyclaceae bacterium]
MSIEQVTIALARMALDAGQMRQTAIASNIANVNNPSYVPLSVSFEDQLDAARRTLQAGGPIQGASLDGVRAQWLSVPGGNEGQGVQLDSELAAMSANSLQFQTLIRGVAKHYALLQIAFTEGKK